MDAQKKIDSQFETTWLIVFNIDGGEVNPDAIKEIIFLSKSLAGAKRKAKKTYPNWIILSDKCKWVMC